MGVQQKKTQIKATSILYLTKEVIWSRKTIFKAIGICNCLCGGDNSTYNSILNAYMFMGTDLYEQ